MENNVKYPNIKLRLTNTSSNAFAIIGKAKETLRLAGISREEINEFINEATNGDYNNVLQTCMRWMDVE